MASSATEHHLSLLILLSLLLLTHARLNLDRSDHKTFAIIQKDLRINGQSSPSTTPCNTPGVFCERRLSFNHTYVLRITRITFKSLRLAGFLSPAIGRLTELKELSLPNNQLVGRIPAQLLKCKKLEILDLGSNSFLGEVPSELSILVRLQVLDLSSNQFSGKLGFLKHFPNLETLNLADNLFTGKVPKSIRSFRNLQFFDFSGNRFLEGQVPVMSKAESSVSQYPKRYIFVENNVPNASKNGSSSALAPATSNAQAPTSLGVNRKHKNKEKKVGAWILGFLAGAAAGCLSGFVFSVIFKIALSVIRGGGKGTGVAIFSSIIKKEEDLAFLEKEDGLTGLECIGSGGCGQVFRAELPDSNGKIIAIKKIPQQPKDAAELSEEETHHMNITMRQIRSEIKTVGQIRHRNLLPLLAHVSRPDCHLLVYEFMKNGSLHDALTQVAQGTREFDWLARHKVALGIASGLEYLHVSHGTQIIHRDLKPANILLDDDMEARIADFGLAKTMPDGNTHMTASNVAGTKGYIAPEYHQTLKLTEKSDIFSFGVILGGLVMGKSPTDEFFQHTDEMYMMKWLKNVMTSENPSQAIDSKLMGNGYEEQMLLVLKIAVFCTADDPKQRPNSKEVRCMLEQIKH